MRAGIEQEGIGLGDWVQRCTGFGAQVGEACGKDEGGCGGDGDVEGQSVGFPMPGAADEA